MLQDFLAGIGGPRRILIGVVGLGVAALILVGSRLATAPEWVPAISSVPIETSAALADKLDQGGIKYRLERGGSEIMVAQEDLAKARVTLAKDGVPGGGRPGLEIFDRPTWGWNDFTQRVNYRRALEGELERTIGRMKGITRAEVHIAISEQSAFRRPDERPATASVLLATDRSSNPAPEIVQGIQHLVSSSVDGLAMENVSIHDETGRQWSEPNDGSLAGLSAKQLRAQQDVEKYLEKKAEDLVTQMVGPNNARVQISANINFDKVERTTQSVDPDKQAITTEQKAEIVPGAQGGAASSNTAASYDNSKSTEVFSGAIGNIRRLTVAVLVNDATVPSTGAADTIPKTSPRTAAELSRIETLVRSAVGVDSARGDAVSVVSLPFEKPKVAIVQTVEPTLIEKSAPFQRPVLMLIGLLVAFLLATSTIKTLRKPIAATMMLQSAIAGAPALAAAPTMREPAPPSPPREPKLRIRPADTEVRDKVIETVERDPDNAIRLVKAWMKEG